MNFPGGQVVGRADFYFTTGVGIATGHDPIRPILMLRFHGRTTAGLRGQTRSFGSSAGSRRPKQLISLVSCTGRTTWQGRRWRLDVSSGVYASFMFATMSDDPRAV
jgi:hypothetical protein